MLGISPVRAEDAGAYSVVVANDDGSVTSDMAWLSMNVALPTVSAAITNFAGNAGASASLVTSVLSAQPVTCRWTRYGVPLSDDNRISGSATTNLVISSLAASDTGWFWLTASNGAGVLAGEPIRLSVTTEDAVGAALSWQEGAWIHGGGGDNWVVQSNLTHDGSNAMRSPPISDYGRTYLETVVHGPGELSFFWSVSSEEGWDSFVCSLDGAEVARISGLRAPDWTEQRVAIGLGPHVVRWTYQKDWNTSRGEDAGFLDQVTFSPAPLISVERAAAGIPLPVSSVGDALWFGQTQTNHDGTNAVRSGYITHYQHSDLQTTVTGPGIVDYWWKVSSEGSDPLLLLVDGLEQNRISGEVDWTHASCRIPWGVHTLTWRYVKDYSIDRGADAGWVDQVTYTPVPVSDLAAAAGGLSGWVATGDVPAYGQSEVAFDGVAALRTGGIADYQSSGARCSVTGPGTLNFRWKVSSEDWFNFAVDGQVLGSIAGEVDWTNQTHALRPGIHTLDWTYVKDYRLAAGWDAGWVDTVSFVPAPALPDAVNASDRTWTVSGDANWFSQMLITHDGVAAAQAGDIGDYQSSTLSTTVQGPAIIAFRWKVSSEPSDPLVLKVDGVELDRISGEVDWSSRAFLITNGMHAVSWTYMRDYSIAGGANTGWVDEFVCTGLSVPGLHPQLTPAGFKMSIATQPGYRYRLEAANALVPPVEWTPVSEEVVGDGSEMMLTTVSNATFSATLLLLLFSASLRASSPVFIRLP